MGNLFKTSSKVIGMLFVTAIFSWAQARVARPGTVNYAEGQVTLDGQSIAVSQLGSVEIQPGHVLETEHGKAEVLLTPGTFLRVGDFSSVRMVSPSLTNIQVELLKGEALVEAAQVEKENHLDIINHGVSTQIVRNGLYEFNADQPRVAVYDGQAVVSEDDRAIDVNKGKELSLTLAANLKPQKFNRTQADDLYNWSKLRSEYEAGANEAAVRTIVVGNPGWYGGWYGAGWYGAGWYWSPWYSSWAFVPGNGFLWSPFGFGFYSPVYYRAYGAVRPVYGAVRPAFGGTGFRTAPAGTLGSRPMLGGGGMRGFGGGGHFGGHR